VRGEQYAADARPITGIRGLRLTTLHSVRWTETSSASIFGVRHLITLLAARLLPPVDPGLNTLVKPTLGSVFLFADVGTSQAIIDKHAATHEQLSSLYRYNILFGLVIAGLFALFIPIVAGIHGQPRLLVMMLLAGDAGVVTLALAQFVAVSSRSLLPWLAGSDLTRIRLRRRIRCAQRDYSAS
jgi:PST family polysaccharide transporter